MAPPDEYSTVGGGGRLKLKGSKVQDGSRVDKNKKKKSKSKDKPAESESATSPPPTTTTATGQTEERDDSGQGKSERALDRGSRSGSEAAAVLAGKTEAERRYEEARKRRLHERLKREGIKSHKERVEELNRYLSSLSEHHDMPKIGPG